MRRALGTSGAAAGKGLEATATRARGAGPALGRLVRPLGRLLTVALTAVLRILAVVERILGAVVGLTAAVAGALTRSLARILTPERGVVLVTVAAAACLVVSQFVEYRGVEVGQPAYAEVASIAPAPQVDREDAGEPHAYLLIPLAAVAALLAVAALATRRWQLGRLVALAGVLGVAVVLAVDLPHGLDEGAAASAYAGAHATLVEGFYAELAASAVLALCGLLLALDLRRADRPVRRRLGEHRRARSGNAPSLARSGS